MYDSGKCFGVAIVDLPPGPCEIREEREGKGCIQIRKPRAWAPVFPAAWVNTVSMQIAHRVPSPYHSSCIIC